MDTLLYLGKASLIIALFYGVYQFALKRETFFTLKRHFLWVGILAAIAVPFIEITKTIYRELPSQLPVFSAESLPTLVHTPEEAILFSWEQLAFTLYLMGASLFLLRFLKQFVSLVSFLHGQSITKQNGYSYIETSFETPPFSFFNYIVYNPNFHTKEDLEMILKHEEVHALQKHSIDTLLANLLLVFLWFNPLAWRYKKSMEENLEFIADQATVAQTNALKQYQLALVKASSASTITGLATNFHQSFIKKRIIMLNKRKSHRNNTWKLSIILPFLALFLWSFNVKEVVTYTENTTTSASEVPKSSPSFSPSEAAVTESNIEKEDVNASEEHLEENTPSTKETAPLSEGVSDAKTVSSTATSFQEIVFQISKNSTKEELDALQKELKNKGFTFSYSNVSYNSKQEIIAITITYKDANGNSGKYGVSSDDPINTIIIASEGTRLSVRSIGNSSTSNTQQITVTSEEREEKSEKMRQKMEQRREEMEKRREEMIEASNKRREKFEARSNELRKRLQNNANHRTDSLTHRFSQLDTSISRRQSARQDRSNLHTRTARSSVTAAPKNTKQITKTTTEAELKAFKSEFKAAGISFSYSGIRRNDANEITKIKLKIDNNNGSVASSTYAKSDAPITTIVVGADENATLLSTRDQ